MNNVTHNTNNTQYKNGNSSTNWFDKNQATYSAETLENELKRRGILQSAMACHWSIAPHWLEHDNGKGMAWAWSIPTNQREYNLIKFYRPKAMRWSKTAQWQDGITKTTKVYIGQGWGRLMKAVAKTKTLYIANGQVDHLTFIEAGHDNVISFYGESSVPKDELLKLIEALGNVQTVLNWPDRDTAGITGATKLRNILHPVGVAFSAFELPYELGTKKDTNDLWVDVAFDARQFNRTLLACPLLELPSQHEATILPPVLIPTPTAVPTSKASKGQLNWDALHRDVQSRLERDYHLDRRGGCVCPMHPQTSNKRDAKLNDRSLHCFVCGTHAIADVAKRLGIQIEHYRETIEGGATVLTLPLEQYLESLKPYRIQFTANRMIEAQYVNTVLDANILDESRLIGIQSPTGTGKTELLLEVIPNVLRQGKKVIIIGHRRKLLRNTHKRLRDNGIKATNYEDATDVELLLANVLLITVDSLPRLTNQADFDPTAYGLMVMDEATQVLYHLLKSKTLTGKDRDAFTAFLQVIQHGPILALDANLNDEAMGILADWSTALTNAKPPMPYNILNTYKPIKGKATQFSNLSGMIANMIDRLKKGQRIAIHAPTRQFGYWLNQQLAPYANGIYFDSHTVDFEHQRQALQNLNEAEYQYIIYSPVLGTGYDITRPFDAVFLVGFGTHLTAHDWLQGVGRCRNANELVYYIRERKTKTPHDTATAVEAVYQSRMLATPNATGFDTLDGRALDGYAKMQASRNRMKNHQAGYWLEGLDRHGYGIPVIDDSVNQLIEDALKNMKESIKTASIAKMLPVAETEFVTDEGYNSLRREQDRTGQQLITEQTYWANQAWGIFNLTGIPNNEETLDYFYTPTNRNRFLAFYREHFQLAPALDEEEARRKVLVHRRQYATGKDDLLARILGAIWDKNTFAEIAKLKTRFTKDEALERLAKVGLADSNGITLGLHNKLVTIFNRRNDGSKDVYQVLKFLLGLYGMKLIKHQRMVKGERFFEYWFDEAEFMKLRAFAFARRDYSKPDNDISLTGFKELPPALQPQPNMKASYGRVVGILPPQPVLNRVAVPMRE